jgi:methyl-accepting chemotaxis protein
MTSAIVQPIQQLRYCLSGLAKGDLTNRTNIINQDELGELGQTFNQTLESLSGLVEELYRQSQKVNSATSELTYQANSQVAGSEQQAQAILETTTAMNELNYSTVTIMQQATMVNNSVSGCVQEAEHVNQVVEAMDTAQNRGRQIIARAISGLRVLKEQVSLINEQQQVLVNQSEVMQQVINTLDNIAQNTHLLALNAAIEAAGAGEQGERFRVVAKEVRELSNRSTKYTYEIRKALSSVAASVEQVNTLGKQCLQEAEHAVHDSSNADLVLVELANLGQQVKLAANSILEKVMQSAILAEDIGVSISQQQSISTQTVEKMLSINAITSQNLNSIKQGEVATFELDRTAQALTKSANSFKLIMINT